MHNPEIYQESNFLHRRDVPACLQKMTPKIKWKNNNRVIDIGCADGSVTNLLETFLPVDYKLLGCDISENMVVYAAERYSHEQTSFTVLDIAGDLPEKMKGNFDHAFSFYAINWVIDQQRAFENIFNLLDQDGECVIVLVAKNGIFDVYRTLTQNSKWNTWICDIEQYISPYYDSKEPDKEIIKLMENIGFVNIEVDCKDTSYRFEDRNILKKFLTALNPFDVPEEKYDDFMEDYIQVLKDIQSTKVNSNKPLKDVTLYYQSITIYGRKPSTKKY